MVYSKRKPWDTPKPELPKDNASIPEGLGIGEYEIRMPNGQLAIYFEGSPTSKGAAYVILGKYLKPDHNSMQFYVTDKRYRRGMQNAPVSKHEHLIMAIAKITELQDEYEREKGNGN